LIYDAFCLSFYIWTEWKLEKIAKGKYLCKKGKYIFIILFKKELPHLAGCKWKVRDAGSDISEEVKT